jgi:DNA replication protein DnaC
VTTPTSPTGLYEQLKEDLGYPKLTRAAEVLPMLLDRARAEGLSHAQFLAGLVAEEAAATRNRRLSARLRFAHFPVRRSLDEFDFDFQPSVDRKLIDDLASLRFVTEGRPILLLGQPGCGKSHSGDRAGHPSGPGRRPRLLHLRC